LAGTKNIAIPKGIESGEILKIKGEGFTRTRGYGRGDQIVQIIVKTPKNLSKKQEEILRDFEELGKREDRGGNGWKGFFKKGN